MTPTPDDHLTPSIAEIGRQLAQIAEDATIEVPHGSVVIVCASILIWRDHAPLRPMSAHAAMRECRAKPAFLTEAVSILRRIETYSTVTISREHLAWARAFVRFAQMEQQGGYSPLAPELHSVFESRTQETLDIFTAAYEKALYFQETYGTQELDLPHPGQTRPGT